MKILIKNGRIIDPANNIDKIADLLVDGDKIAKVAEGITDEADKVIDAADKWVIPGLIDLHVHLRDPGYEHKETIATGTRAGAMGGFTTVCAMPNTDPVTDNEILVEYIKMKAARDGVINVLPIGAITKGQQGSELADIGKMAQVGACAISEDGKSVSNPALMKNALRYAKMFDLPVFDHCEEITLAKGSMNAGDRASLLGLKGISNDSEELIVARDMILAGSVKAKIHLCHISTAESVIQIKQAKERGIAVTAEATPHHFTLSEEDITGYDANFKMNPPLRSKKDAEAIRQALKDGTIEVIATDHAPHHTDEKNCEFEKAANGIIGLETALPLGIKVLVEGGWLTPSELIAKMTVNPARVLGIDKGTLGEGMTADITIVDPNAENIFDVSKMASKAKNTPFGGYKAKGKVLYTIVSGETVVENGKLLK